MNLGDFLGRARERFSRQEFPAPPPVTAQPGQTPVTIVMPGQQGRKVSTPIIAGGAVVVLVALYFAGHNSAHVDTPVARANDPTPTNPSSIKDWSRQPAAPAFATAKTPQQQAEEAYAAQQQLAGAQNLAYAGAAPASAPGGNSASPAAMTPAQQAAEDRRKADEDSLRASTVIAIPDAVQPASPAVLAQVAASVPGIQYAAPAPPQPSAQQPAAPAIAEDKTRKDCVDRMDGDVKKYALCEGTVLPAISEFRLVGEFAGPVQAAIARDIFARDGKHLLIPRGTVALGDAKRVGTANQRRMDVNFHRMILPDGRGVVLEKMIALDQAGETALSGKVNRHLLSTFGTAAVIGGLAGFSQIGSGSAYTGGGIDAYRQGIASSTAQQGQTVLNQGLNRSPEITVPEGKVLMIYLSDDLHLPEFVPAAKTLLKRDESQGETR